MLDQVLLVGTEHYTSIGRPIVGSCKVYASLEEKSLSEKVIIFKKRRRKGYQKNANHRQNIVVLKIDKIVHDLPENFDTNYHVMSKGIVKTAFKHTPKFDEDGKYDY
jgi:hypothetical protein